MKGCSWLLTAALTAVRFMTGHFKSTNGPIRLWRNGSNSTEFTSGRVQLVYDSVWGNICWDANFGLTEADVICHQLGYTGALDYSRASHDEFGIDTSPTVLNNVDCSTSSYLVILQCDYETSPPLFSCTDDDDVSVVCNSTRIWDNPYAGQVCLTGGSTVNKGLVEVYCNGQWGDMCESYIGLSDANTICRQLGYYSSSNYYYPSKGTESSFSSSGGTTIDTCINAHLPVEVEPIAIVGGIFGGVAGILVIFAVVCMLGQFIRNCRKEIGNFEGQVFSSPNAQPPPSTRILLPPGFITDPQPAHTRSSYAYTPLPNSDKPPSVYDLHGNLATHNTQRTNERSNLPQSHQASYGACIPTTSHPTAPVAPPPPIHPPYPSSAAALVAPPPIHPPYLSSAAAPVAPPPIHPPYLSSATAPVAPLSPYPSSAAGSVAPPPYSSGGYTTGTSAVSAL